MKTFFSPESFTAYFCYISISGSLLAYAICMFVKKQDIFNNDMLYTLTPFLVGSAISSKVISSVILKVFIRAIFQKGKLFQLHEFSPFSKKVKRINDLKEKLQHNYNIMQSYYDRSIFFTHNIRTPLGAVKNIVHHSIEENALIAPKDKLSIHSCINEIILQSNNYMNLQANSRIKNTTDVFLVADVINNINNDFEDSGVSVFNNIKKPISLNGSKFDFYSIFANLIQNAIDASTGKGICQNICQVNFTDHVTSIQVSIIDSCGGMPESVYKQLGEKIPSKKENSNGIGIKSSLKFISDFNGFHNINTLNEYGGTTWSIIIPLMKPNIYTNYIFTADRVKKFIISSDKNMISIFQRKIKCESICSFTDIKEQMVKITSKDNLIFLDMDTMSHCFNLIEANKLTNITYLLSDSYEDPYITSKAIFFRVKVIPKKYIKKLHIKSFEV